MEKICGKAVCVAGGGNLTLKISIISDVGKEKYIEEAFRNNRLLCIVASVFCLAVEGFNIIRVLFGSDSGLNTLNNRIYFGFYTFLLVCSILYLIYDRQKEKSFRKGNRISLIYIGIVLFWNTCLNIYDIFRSDHVHVTMASTMLVAFSALVIVEPVYGLIIIWANYFIFMTAAQISLFSGDGINYTLTALMASVICIVRFRHICIELDQSRQIHEIGEKLHTRRFWLTKEQYDLISQNAGFITFQWDPEKDKLVFSKNWRDFFENDYEIPRFSQFLNSCLTIEDAEKKKIRECMEAVRRGAAYQKFAIKLLTRGNIQRWFKIQVACQRSSSDESMMYAIGFMNDITKEKEQLIEFQKNATLDATGLLNKASIGDCGRNWLESLHLKSHRIAMLILDMDDFKNINDTYGHPCGDHVLKQVADIMVKYAPENAKIGRFGGDEFMVLLKVGEDTAYISEYAEKVIRHMADICWNGQKIETGCSIGFAVTENAEWDYEKLYQCADEALYMAKKAGKKRVCEFGKYEKYPENGNDLS